MRGARRHGQQLKRAKWLGFLEKVQKPRTPDKYLESFGRRRPSTNCNELPPPMARRTKVDGYRRYAGFAGNPNPLNQNRAHRGFQATNQSEAAVHHYSGKPLDH